MMPAKLIRLRQLRLFRRAAVLALGLAIAGPAAAAMPAAPSAVTTYHVPVLMYHHVRPHALVSPTEPFPDLYVDSVTFDAQMAALKAWGWKTITSAQLAAAVKAGASIPSRTLVLSFDDGRPDNYA